MIPGKYGELKAKVQIDLNRNDARTVGQIPAFVRHAHDEIVRALPSMPGAVANTAFPITGERVNWPNDFGSLLALTLEDASPVRATTIEQRAEYAVALPPGVPRYVANEGTQAAFAPVPETVVVATLVYRANAAFFVTDEDTNTILRRWPSLYLFGALAAGFRFNKYWEDADRYEGMFRALLADVKRDLREGETAGLLRPVPNGAVA